MGWPELKPEDMMRVLVKLKIGPDIFS